ncbi:hypothetical protein EI94DRAFT_1707491 [Lactarius quietus]|nr:hypothetical protein EI94DRAFT_1707491 [Lactarius quietus]
MASKLTQVEVQFLAIAARLFAAAMIFLAHPPDDGQQIYLDRKVKDEMTSLEKQFNAFMGDPMKVRKKPRVHPIIQITAQEWRAAEAEQRMPNWGIFTLDHISGVFRITGDVAMEGLAAPAQPSVPVPPVSLTMPDAPAVTKGKGRALPPAGLSNPHGTLPTPIAQPTPPYDFRNTRRHPVVQPLQGTSTTTQSNEFEDCMLSDMIADMDSTPSAQGRASDSSLPHVQVDDASPPPPAQRHRLDVKPLIATGDYRCGPCKSRKINNAECVSQINQSCLTFKCVYCAERRRPCAPAASWAQPVIRVMKLRKPTDAMPADLDLPPGVEASYGPLVVGTSSIYPVPFQDISNPHHLVDHLPPAITPYLPLESPIHPRGFLIRCPNPNHVPAPGQSTQYIVGKAALRPLCTSEEETLEAWVARLLSRNEICIVCVVHVYYVHVISINYFIKDLAPVPRQVTRHLAHTACSRQKRWKLAQPAIHPSDEMGASSFVHYIITNQAPSSTHKLGASPTTQEQGICKMYWHLMSVIFNMINEWMFCDSYVALPTAHI